MSTFSLRSSVKKFSFYLLIAILAFFICTYGWVITYKWVNPPFSTLMLIRKIEYILFNQKVSCDRKWINLENTSIHLIQSILAAEDHNFLKHKGYLWENMKKAFKKHRKRKNNDPIVGYSTISQQTAKNIFLFPSCTYFRKGLELYFTILIEKFLGKKRIFELYLNYVELGHGIYGFETAAQFYFHKSAALLSLHESSILTALLTNPRDYSINGTHPFVTLRCSHICFMVMTHPQFSIYAEILKFGNPHNPLFNHFIPIASKKRNPSF